MRLFVASSFEPQFSAVLKDVENYARDNAGRDAVKWTDPDNFHLTYAFLGELGPQAAASARKGVEAALAGVASFRISTGGFGAFPSSRRPGVLWLGIGEGAAELRALAAKLAEGLAAAGIMYEDRFEPHVTLGRVKRPLPEPFMRRVADFAASRRAVSAVTSVELMESRLTPDGPVYAKVFSKELL